MWFPPSGAPADQKHLNLLCIITVSWSCKLPCISLELHFHKKSLNLRNFMIPASKPCPNHLFLKCLEPVAKIEGFHNFSFCGFFPIMENSNKSGEVRIMFCIKDATLSGAEKVDNFDFLEKVWFSGKSDGFH